MVLSSFALTVLLFGLLLVFYTFIYNHDIPYEQAHALGLQTMVIPSKGTYGLDTAERKLPVVLKDAGYRTTMIGKWHLGHADIIGISTRLNFDHAAPESPFDYLITHETTSSLPRCRYALLRELLALFHLRGKAACVSLQTFHSGR